MSITSTPTIGELGRSLHELLCHDDATSDCDAHLAPGYDHTGRAASHAAAYLQMAERLLQDFNPAQLAEFIEALQSERPL